MKGGCGHGSERQKKEGKKGKKERKKRRKEENLRGKTMWRNKKKGKETRRKS